MLGRLGIILLRPFLEPSDRPAPMVYFVSAVELAFDGTVSTHIYEMVDAVVDLPCAFNGAFRRVGLFSTSSSSGM
jgi:hypothetical protein